MSIRFKVQAILAIVLLAPIFAYAGVYNIAQMGAQRGGEVDNAKIIQSAIDSCSSDGGGVVVVDGGTYMSSTLYMKSGVTLRIETGSTLLANPNIESYPTDTHKNMYKNEPHMDRCFIFARDAHNFSLEGGGTIDGNGHFRNFKKVRPMMIRFINCSKIRLTGLQLINPAAWTSAWLYCTDIAVSDITIHSRVNNNGDGLDFDGCQNVRVTNSDFDTSDDCICLQTSDPEKPCQNVVISNCTFASKWAAIRIGLLSRSTISNVAVSNCTFRDIKDSGLKIQQNEGGKMQNMVFSNLVMTNVPRPIFMTFCQQRACTDAPEELAPLDYMGGFMFQNILVDNSMCDVNSAFIFSGITGHYIEDVALRDVTFIVGGGGTKEQAERKSSDIPEFTPEVLSGWWPEYKRLGGVLPTHGIFARHIRNLIIDNVRVKSVNPDLRPLIFTQDTPNIEVENLKKL